ncbi:MAG TPA: response regulator [Actinomycetota bacterium]|nr:response regulator [Actinomycetota bacterium]
MRQRKQQPSADSSSATDSAGIELMLVDDHPMWRDTLRNLLLHSKVGTVVAEAGDGDEALAQAALVSPDLVVMDINLPTIDGIEATRRLVRLYPDIKVLMLSSSDDRAQVVDAVRAGASGYLLKTAAPSELVDAVRRIHLGEIVFPPSLAAIVLDELRLAQEVGGPSLRVLIADQEILPREGLGRLLTEAGLDVVAGTGDAKKVLGLLRDDRPDVAILDAGVAIGGDREPSLAQEIRHQFPEVGLLVLSADPVAAQAVALLSEGEGGIGYLLKRRITDIDEVTDAIRRVAHGESVVDSQVVSGLVEQPAKSAALGTLTDREQEVLALMAEGHSNQAIAAKLVLGSKTVETHVSRIFMKLGLEPATEIQRRVLAVLAYLRAT